MAIIQHGANGGFSGKAGSVVGYYRNGKWIIRGLPKYSSKNKKGTVDQNISRGRFAAMQYFLKPIVGPIRVGFNMQAKREGKTAHNCAMSWNMLHAFDENGQIDVGKIRVSSGSLTGAESPNFEIIGDEFVVTWSDNSKPGSYTGSSEPQSSDQAIILLYDVETGISAGGQSGARRSDKQQRFPIHRHSDIEFKYHCWISFISDNRMHVSTSEYLGVVTVAPKA